MTINEGGKCGSLVDEAKKRQVRRRETLSSSEKPPRANEDSELPFSDIRRTPA